MPERTHAALADMSPTDGNQRLKQTRRRLWFLRERLKDVGKDPMLTTKQRREKEAYSTKKSSKPEDRRWSREGTERA